MTEPNSTQSAGTHTNAAALPKMQPSVKNQWNEEITEDSIVGHDGPLLKELFGKMYFRIHKLGKEETELRSLTNQSEESVTLPTGSLRVLGSMKTLGPQFYGCRPKDKRDKPRYERPSAFNYRRN